MGKGIFDIRYVKLHFTLRMVEDTVMPKYKASAIRGGLGEMLLRANCIRDRQCEKCDFETECIVRRTMYSKMEIQPRFMSSGDSVGYVTECEDYREEFRAGDEWNFNLILFGKNIVYFSQYMSALYALGMNGLGKEHSRFEIVSVTNTKGRELLRGNDISMSEYNVTTVSDYISFRKKQMKKEPYSGEIKFKTPLTLKYRGEILREFAIEPVFEAARRRVYMLDCFEGIEDNSMQEEVDYPSVLAEEHRGVSVRRYSTHSDSAMNLQGIEGIMRVESLSDKLLDVLLAGELVHIGKNTSFGFGRYRIF